MNEKEPQQPVKELRSKAITAAVWRHEHEEQERTISRYSVRIRTRWHDRRTGEWKDTRPTGTSNRNFTPSRNPSGNCFTECLRI